MLGWKTTGEKAAYKLSLPQLSEEESSLVLCVCDKFRISTQKKEVTGEGEARQLLSRLLAQECEEQGYKVDNAQSQYLLQSAFLQTFGLGFLQELLSDDSLEEIAIIGIGLPIYVYSRGKGWKKTNVSIASQEYFISLVNRLGRPLGRRLTAQKPRVNAVLEDGSRMHASMPPVSSCELTIRKFRADPISAFDLISYKTYDAFTLSLLSLSVQSDLTLMVAGNTASGKTSTLNSLLSFVPESERVVIIEETPEISIPHPHQLRLLPFEEGGISMVELVRDSLRMRPDRLVVGEVRSSQEASSFVESALSGQTKKCYCTFHAKSARDALLRLRMMGCLESDLEGIDMFIIQRRVSTYDSGKRTVGEIRRLSQIAVCAPGDAMRPKAVFDGKSFSASGIAALLDKISEGSGLGHPELKRELALRRNFFSKNAHLRGYAKSFHAIQRFMFKEGAHG